MASGDRDIRAAGCRRSPKTVRSRHPYSLVVENVPGTGKVPDACESLPGTLRYVAADLQQAVEDVVALAAAAVRNGSTILVLSDRAIDRASLPIHSLLTTGAVHHHLIKQGLRIDANIVVETAITAIIIG